MKRVLKSGISIVEVIVGVAIVGLITVFVSYTLTLFFNASEQTLDRAQAMYLAEEGQEILRYLRDSDWNTLASLTIGTTYYLDVATTSLSTTTTAEIIDETFTRGFELSEVRRDNSTDDIVTSGGSVDTGSLESTFSVSWGNSTTTLTTLFMKIFDI